MSPKDLRSLSGEAQAAIRERAVRAVIGGMSHREVAEIFGVKRAVVSKWMRRWRDGGWEGLAEGRRGRRPGEQQALLPWQQGVIVTLIKEQNPDQLQLPGFLWTRDAVLELIDQRFGIRLAVTTVGRYLRAWGFTPQVPAHQALERDPAAVKQWLAVGALPEDPRESQALRGNLALAGRDRVSLAVLARALVEPEGADANQAGHRPAVRREHDLGDRQRRVAALSVV